MVRGGIFFLALVNYIAFFPSLASRASTFFPRRSLATVASTAGPLVRLRAASRYSDGKAATSQGVQYTVVPIPTTPSRPNTTTLLG